ncbi:hypothetical protein Mycch_5107 [Mycolicibacterium chubuense NBB4]|uniref:Uncharacterized protein n=1 Tax=Mycolicibacterium chubuense (strain NBB4) TaxID=710421 RepID=I4BR86_MYCCN|nr:hypothetical protein [Mycolicibacterium chubuense]AFM19793.1 hypothetical protein Mycch_5107 [Mycolicibacterium chubuense NBB4]
MTTSPVGRLGALLAVCSAALHGGSLPGSGSAWAAGVMTVMLAGCLYCAYELWRFDTTRSWVLVAVMNLAMIGVHMPMTGGHHHGGAVGTAAGLPVAMELATVVALAEVILAAAVLFVRSRRVAPR